MLPPSTRMGRNTNRVRTKAVTTKTTIRARVRFGRRPMRARRHKGGSCWAGECVSIHDNQYRPANRLLVSPERRAQTSKDWRVGRVMELSAVVGSGHLPPFGAPAFVLASG